MCVVNMSCINIYTYVILKEFYFSELLSPASL
jgi:hypothetical protein